MHHAQRIKQELEEAGLTRFGQKKLESKYLASIIHPDEHIKGIVYGKMNFLSAVLIATDRRVIYINKQPLLTTVEELTYDVVSGVKFNKAGLFAALTLHTRIGDYSLRYVNEKSALNFIKYIESRRIESGGYGYGKSSKSTPSDKVEDKEEITVKTATDDAKAIEFLKSHDTAVLSTVDSRGTVRGAIVYYLVSPGNQIHILTKTESAKARSLFAHNQVALTVHEPGTLQTVQLEGVAEAEQDSMTKKAVSSRLIQPRLYRDGAHLPPVTKLESDSNIVIRIDPTFIRYRNYSKNK